jgi:hypothetical protein
MAPRQCELEGCTKWAVSGGTPYCTAHGGGKRCQEEMYQVGYCRRHASLHRAWRGQALPDGGLRQVRSRRHGALYRAWRGQAVPRGEMYQGSCCKRHAPLHRTRRRQAVPRRGLHQVRSRRHAALVLNLQFSILMAQTTDPSSWR